MKKLLPNTNKLNGEPPKKNKLVNLLSNGITLPSPNKNDRDYEMKTVKCKVLKVKFQNLGENGAEAHFKWEPRSGCFIPQQPPDMSDSKLPWE
jgi:hypothetical protein